jgi:hypothetical protein
MTDNATYRPKTILKKYDLRFKDGKMFFVPVEDEQPKSQEKNMEQEKPHQPSKYTLPPRVLEKTLAAITPEVRTRFLELLKTRLANLQIDPSAASGEKPLTEEDEDKVIKSIKKALITTYAERRKLNATMMEQYANLTADPPDKIPVEVTAALNHLLEEQDLVAYIARIVTDRRIYGSDRSIFSSGFLRFEVPYNTVLSTETFNYGLQKVLWIQYREGENTKEVSILGGSIFGGPNRQNVTRAYELLQRPR